jgi:hypothetical protein
MSLPAPGSEDLWGREVNPTAHALARTLALVRS